MKRLARKKKYFTKLNNFQNGVIKAMHKKDEKVKILMVDDHPENLLALEAVLASPNYILVKAGSGAEALKHLLKDDFAVILLDVQMPGMNGFETAKLIKERERTKYIPIIFITAINQDTEHVLHGYSVGAIDYIFKPFQPETLKLKVSQFVDIYRNQKKIQWQSEMLQKEIQERKKIEQNLYYSQERFKKIFQSSPAMMGIWSLEDNKFIDVNKSWLHYSGYNYEEIVNQEGMELFFQPKIKDYLTSPEIPIHNAKVKYLTKVHQIREGLLSGEIIDIQGEKCMLLVITDITEKLHFEKELARLDRLKLTGELAAGFAHEIRNPMTTVGGFLQLAKENRDILSPDIIDLMMDELNRANTTITEFLTMSRSRITDKKLCCLNHIVEVMFPLVEAEAFCADKLIELELGNCPELYLVEKEIRQMILNLTMNGLESMPPKGKLTIRTYSDSQSVVMDVIDQGPGIREEDMEKIGTPFFTTKEGGTGLGLAVCYGIADHHNAVIEIDTGKNGTTFRVRFAKP